MKLSDYIKGSRRGKAANRLERQAMEDPFLADALEGYDRVPGDHTERIMDVRKRMITTNRKRHMQIRSWSAVASLVVLVVLSVYFLMNQTQVSPIAQNEDSTADIPVEETTIILPASTPALARSQKTAPMTDIVLDSVENESVYPQPLVGEEAYHAYIRQSLIHPTDEICRNRQGCVVLRFYINSEGRPYDIQVIQPLCDSADKEAMRLIEEGPSWTISEQAVEWKIEF
ncbi:energy transducer TonB [Parabacteroides sp. PF5-9]|uniref:energy transducer TonB n=1 Tax=Parabacteroides sp. PF5-9 TaxID=1742404 RepID=UPI0024737973|nr:energy transducer TonB [Parabacteroides sp. PF5-9]MDH6358683.1 outer membrane biosynthesis protein TonB [Parabacteroides sp. PF5-9]